MDMSRFDHLSHRCHHHYRDGHKYDLHQNLLETIAQKEMLLHPRNNRFLQHWTSHLHQDPHQIHHRQNLHPNHPGKKLMSFHYYHSSIHFH